jgi:chromosome segregation ATPase
MPFFGRKKEEVRLPTSEELEMNVGQFKPVEQLIKETERPKGAQPKQERPAFAPLFIKLDRYKQILNSITELKTTLVMIKNSLSVLNELEKLKSDNLKMIEKAIERFDKRISALDSEFLRPSGYHEELPEELYGIESLEATLTGLRDQVNHLKAELENLA